MFMCLLSVIIPVYNKESYIKACLDSIFQAVSNDKNLVEIVIVNDGSTDKSGAICEEYAAEHANIRLFHKENGGVSSARNLGLQHAAGRYIAWVDPDDLVSPDWFEKINAAIAQGEPDVIVMDTLRFGEEGEQPEVYGRSSGFVDRDLFVEDTVRDLRMLSGLPNKIMKANLFAGIRFDESLSILEDYDAMPHILRPAKSVYYIDKCLYLYRQYAGSLLHRDSAEISFGAVKTAMARLEKCETKFFCAAITAAAWQAFRFCRNQYLYADFGASKEQEAFCRAYVRSHLPDICKDDISLQLKVKMILLGCGLYKFICRFKNNLLITIHL